MPAGFKSRSAKGRVDLSRPSVNLDFTVVDREWRHVAVQDLTPGDIVASRGKVVSSQPTCRDAEIALEVGVPDSKTYFMNYGDKLLAFVKKEN